MTYGWLTPDEIPETAKCRLLRIPDNLAILMAVSGALVELTKAHNWQEFGAVTPEQISDAMRTMYFDFMQSLNDCEEPVSVPVGTIVQFGAGGAPDGWLLCNGNHVLKADYPALWDAITDIWGVSEIGDEYFVLPDFRDRSPFGYHDGGGATKSFGHYYGTETVTLTESQMPIHKHKYGAGGGSGSAITAQIGTSGSWLKEPQPETESAGSGAPHNNLHPVAVCGFIIYAGG